VVAPTTQIKADMVVSSNLEVGTSNLFVDTETGNVGIGTTSPARAFEIVRPGGGAIINLKRSDFGTGQGALAFVNAYSNVAASIGAARSGAEGGELVFYTAPNDTTQTTDNPYLIPERMRIDSSGNVGIGTTNPTHQLHIGPKDNDHIYLASSNNSYGWTIDTDDQGSGTVPFRIIKRTDGVDSTVLTIKNQDGNVGIGMANPGYKLDVSGTGRFTGTVTAPTFSGNAETATTATNQSGGTVSATSYTLTGDTTPHKQSIKNSANLSVGWYRIAENGNAVDTDANGSRCSARFTIIDYDSGRHSTRTLYAGGTYGNKPFIHLLTNTSYSGDGIISKVRVVEGSTYEGLAVEIYVDTACSTNEIRIVMDDNYQGNGFTMVDFESVVADHSNMNEYELNLNTTFWGMFLDNTTTNICMLESGNVGIGTASPATDFHVGVGDANIRIGAINYSGSAADTTTYGLERSRNQILFSTWRDAQTDKIGAKICGINKQTYSSPTLRHLIQSTDLAFYTVPPGSASYDGTVERLRITDTGYVGIGTVSPGYKLHVNGDIYATGNITGYSDKRAKSDIQKIENALDKIDKLNGYTFTMNDKRYTGVIAQEVLPVLPEAVTGSEETHYAVAYGNMMGLIIEAIKELKKKIEQ